MRRPLDGDESIVERDAAAEREGEGRHLGSRVDLADRERLVGDGWGLAYYPGRDSIDRDLLTVNLMELGLDLDDIEAAIDGATTTGKRFFKITKAAKR